MAEKKGRGFAGMDDAKQRAIASKGGKAAHQKGTAHEFTPEEARAAGRKGGQAAHQKGTAHQFTPEEARAAGRKGGQAARDRVKERPFPGEEPGGKVPPGEPALFEPIAAFNGPTGPSARGEAENQLGSREASGQPQQ
jgi:general stress protein YciG